ncbi:conserved hypothetical protein [Cupriavidus necator]|uniref:DUF1656 domain-containing protein n=1 Tax=Cupriavidus necator TaxID=106590 RepID=A0A1K0IPZ2_CUPNE|nr:conserved hypothetical protein [Cupriavidus necator]
MPREIALASILMPSLLPVFVGCLLLYLLVDRLLVRLGVYRRVWHPALFRASLFISIFSGIGLALWR